MKICFSFLLSALFLLVSSCMAQSVSTQYRADLNGNLVPYDTAVSASKGAAAVITKNVNGRSVPLEKSEERILSESPSGKVTETIVHRYGADGVETGVERTITEEQKHPEGGSTVKATIYRGDINGNMQPGEQQVIETQKHGDLTSVETVILRPSLNGGFQTVEQRKAATTGTKDANQQNEVIYRVDSNGQLHEAARNATSFVKQGDRTTVRSEHSEPDLTGRMALQSREEKTVTKAADGSEVEQINVFGPQPTRSGSSPESLRQQKTILRKPGADGIITETTTMSLPSTSDPNRLEKPVLVSETVCSGKCQEPKK